MHNYFIFLDSGQQWKRLKKIPYEHQCAFKTVVDGPGNVCMAAEIDSGALVNIPVIYQLNDGLVVIGH